jgi:hypothetical protein
MRDSFVMDLLQGSDSILARESAQRKAIADGVQQVEGVYRVVLPITA